LAGLYYLYELELYELLLLTKKHNSKLIFVTTPLNLASSGIENCFPPSQEFQRRFQQLKKMASTGEFQKAYSISKGLLLSEEVSPDFYYLHALIAKNLNKRVEALENYDKAHRFSCRLYTTKPVFNDIMRNMAN